MTEITKEYFGIVLYQIKAVRAFGDVEEGELGGCMQKEENLDSSGDARVSSRKHIAWFSSVGSENGTLTAYMTKESTIEVTRGCFRGTIDEFEIAVQERHREGQYAEEYLVLIQFIRIRFRGVVVEATETEEDAKDVN
ncbi:MAG: hypothetical protein ACYCVD_02930 [Desulfitobacteriaceae bacterium]